MATGISRDQRLVPTPAALPATVVISPHSLQAAPWPSLRRSARVEGRGTSIGVVCDYATLAYMPDARHRRTAILNGSRVVTGRRRVVRFVASGDTGHHGQRRCGAGRGFGDRRWRSADGPAR